MNEDEELEKIKKKKMEELKSKKQGTDSPTSPITLNSNNFQDTLEKYSFVVVDFWAPWCGPCKAMEPVIENLAESYAGDVVFGKVNVDENPQLQQKFKVSGIPTLLFFKDGELVERSVGLSPKEQLEAKLNNYGN